MESRHVDVIEMDAASHNGVDDVRQINDAVRYAPVSARYKVYILDEVHMLSTRGVQRAAEDAGRAAAACEVHFRHDRNPQSADHDPVALPALRSAPRRCRACWCSISKASAPRRSITAEPEALALIARAAEGSVRDALSLLDQAIAHAAGSVRAEDVRQMLGLADRTRIIDLFEALMRGDMAKALGELRDQYDSGADPAVVLVRSRRVHAFRHAREDRAGGRRRSARSPKPSARAAARSRRRCRCACSRAPGRCCSRGSPRCRAPASRSPPPKWCWCASPMRPTCRRRTK